MFFLDSPQAISVITINTSYFLGPELKCSQYDGIGMMLGETVICCDKKCGKTCGGDNCGKKMKKNRKDNCCAGRIVAKNKYCGRNRKAPCVIPGILNSNIHP